MKNYKKFNLFKSRYRYFYIFLFLFTLFLANGFFTVNMGQKVFITIAGKVEDKNTNPFYTEGLYWNLPYPISTLYRFNTGELHQLPIGFKDMRKYYSYLDSKKTKYIGWETIHNMERGKKKEDTLIISGDENILDFRGVCNYYITDPVKYVINISKPKVVMKKIIEAEVSLQSGKMNIDDILLFKNSGYKNEIEKKVKEKFKKLDFGIEVYSISIFDIHPPIKIVESFRGVANARELKQKKIYNALQYYNQVLPLARGENAALITRSEAVSYEKETKMKGEVIRLQHTSWQYWKNPKLHKLVKYFARMENILQDKKMYILEGGKNKTLDFRFYK